jgi:hypothetical protein
LKGIYHMGFPVAEENSILDLLFREVAWTPPGTRYLVLFTALSGNGSVVTECANANGYARVETVNSDFSAAAAGAITNGTEITFPEATGSWGTVIAWGIYDSGTYGAGTLKYWGTLNPSRTISAGQTPRFAVGTLDSTWTAESDP